MNTDPYGFQTPAPPPPERRDRKGGFRLVRALKRLFGLAIALALVFALIRFGPTLYYRFFGAGNTQWLSERFSEALHEKNEMVVLEKNIAGQEKVSQSAWLLGSVQEVVVPYTYSLSFAVDLSLARVKVEDGTIVVRLPAPVAKYGKLNVDKDNVKKYDWLLPVTTERYAAILSEIEAKLYQECVSDAHNAEAAWQNAVQNMESLFSGVAGSDALGYHSAIRVLRDESPAQPDTDGEADAPGANAA